MVERARRRRRDESGATAVEFALVLPLLFLVLFGIIDFGWAFGQNLDLKHAAREGARLAVVNGSSGSSDHAGLIAEVDARATELDGDLAVRVALEDATGDGDAIDIGDRVVVCLRYPLRSLSGMSDKFLSGAIRSKAVMRMEKVPTFTSGSSTNWGSDGCTS